ncbi:leucyl aminopeptidase family protein [Hyphococcus flavus]|uniref:Leucyl aminopeptidase family protein n=1 Tax=Hyphococcus flavus TaxID=1866326 RepID=A0AAE9ZDI1_9PROT|nr:leucyl aminopeptidase family protein [Hyphococcus flavus]WDI33053.1 leucyl aminopeptidase family protein [Hyphococcus flavus]
MRDEMLSDYEQKAANAAKNIFMVAEGGLDEIEAPETLKRLAGANGFNGEAGAVLANDEGVLLGLGDGADPFLSAAAAEKLPEGDYVFAASLDEQTATLAALGWLMGGYRFDRYKQQKPANARLIAPENADCKAARRAMEAVCLVRDLVNTPAGDMGPEALEHAARNLAEECGAQISVIEGENLLAENLPMIHAVGRAAASPPRLIDMTWGEIDAPKLTLVGKGVTFDSGGLNIKGGAGMALMKKDMGGGAHTLALARMIMKSKLKVRLRVLVPAVENAISGNAFRPGDILPSRRGLTVEIGNTDAEGRLILADALTLGGEEKPELMISLATLTGAARVALGPELAPFYCDDEGLVSALERAGTAVSDPVWRMPLWRNYETMLSSQIADVNHISGGSFAGSITAALFLKKFADGAGAWMHFDIYAWRPKALPGRPAGGEAQAIRALFEVLSARFPAE